MKPSKLSEGKQLPPGWPTSHNNLDITFLLEAVPSGAAEGGINVPFYDCFSTCKTDRGWLCHSSPAPRPSISLIRAQIALPPLRSPPSPHQRPGNHKPGASLKPQLCFHENNEGNWLCFKSHWSKILLVLAVESMLFNIFSKDYLYLFISPITLTVLELENVQKHVNTRSYTHSVLLTTGGLDTD